MHAYAGSADCGRIDRREIAMAARHLQKLRGQDLLPSEAQDPIASESEDESAEPLNPFDLLDDNEVRNKLDALMRSVVQVQQFGMLRVGGSRQCDRRRHRPRRHQSGSADKNPNTDQLGQEEKGQKKAKQECQRSCCHSVLCTFQPQQQTQSTIRSS